MKTAPEAEQIRQQMASIRDDLRDEVGEIVTSARTLSDWKYYWHRYPWACMAAAAALGYILVPSRLHIFQPDADALVDLARRNKVHVRMNPEQPRGAIIRPLLTLLATTAAREGVNYVGQRFRSGTNQPGGPSA